jgi:hypothetical protein
MTLCLTFRIQEIMDDNQREAGRIPRTVECELTADLGMDCLYNVQHSILYSNHNDIFQYCFV